MSTQLDLSQLAFDRETASPAIARRRKPIVSRYLIPAVVLLGFSAMIGWAVHDRFLPRKAVSVVPVVVTRAEVQQAGTPLFQAAGWVEPRPTPVVVPALAEGIIEELLVVEGQKVTAGQPVARLIDTEAKLALEQAKADLAYRNAELESARATLASAEQKVRNPVHLDAVLAEAESQLAKLETALTSLPFLIQAAEARVAFAEQNLQGKQSAGGAVTVRSVQQAQSELGVVKAELNELEGRRSRLEQEAAALRNRRDALARQRELLIDETGAQNDAAAKVKAAEAQVRLAELAVDQAELRYERMVIRSPRNGQVLSLIAPPGTRVMGVNPGGEQTSNAVVTLYDPQMLQVRADVRLEDVPLVIPGQPVTIETASAKEPIPGRVLYPTSQANIQKNTLEVKVAIDSPPPTIRPEMLVTTTFLAPETDKPDSASEEQERLLVPRQLVSTEADQQIVWIADAHGLARRRSVTLGRASTPELVEVTDGLTATDRLISQGRESLAEGDRLEIREDSQLGSKADAGV